VGRIRAKLFVSSSANDTDFMVTISDLSEDKSMLVRYGAVRMRWRESDEHQASPLVSGRVYEAEVDLWQTAYIFPKGHRVRISISSAAYPYYEANPNTNTPVDSKAEPVRAQNSIHMGPEYPSQLLLPVVKMEDIPENREFGPIRRRRPRPTSSTVSPTTSTVSPTTSSTPSESKFCRDHVGCRDLHPVDGLCCPVADGTRLACCDVENKVPMPLIV